MTVATAMATPNGDKTANKKHKFWKSAVNGVISSTEIWGFFFKEWIITEFADHVKPFIYSNT